MEIEKNGVEEIETTPEQTQGLIRAYENDILGGLLAAADFCKDADSVVDIEIVRKGMKYFSFKLRPLSEEEYQRCRNRNTKYVRNKQVGIKMPEDTNLSRYRSELIYTATMPDASGVKIWDTAGLWTKLNVLNGIDAVDKILMAGEKDMVLSKLDEISGYENNLEEVAKN